MARLREKLVGRHMDSSHVVSPDGTGINARHIDCRIEDFRTFLSDGATSTPCTLSVFQDRDASMHPRRVQGWQID